MYNTYLYHTDSTNFFKSRVVYTYFLKNLYSFMYLLSKTCINKLSNVNPAVKKLIISILLSSIIHDFFSVFNLLNCILTARMHVVCSRKLDK